MYRTNTSPPEIYTMFTYLMKKNIMKLITQKRMLLIIIVLSFAVSVFGMLFYSGFFAYSYYDWLKGEVCRIELSIQNSASVDRVYEIISRISGLSPDAVISIVVSEGEVSKSNYVSGKIIPVIGKYDVLEGQQILLGRYFERDEKSPVALLSESCAAVLAIEDNPIGSTIHHEQGDYTLVGILFNSDYAYIIPVDYYIEHYQVTNITILFNENIERNEVEKVSSDFNEIDDCNYVKQASPFLSTSFLPSLIQILLVYSFTLLNIVLVILLWQKGNHRRYAIYRMCGMRDFHLYLLIAFLITITSFIGMILGYGVYLLVLPVFESLDIVKATLNDYAIITAFVFILVFVFANIYSIRTVRNIAQYSSEE